jgi:Heterokaryon incompatibility protein (HET)
VEDTFLTTTGEGANSARKRRSEQTPSHGGSAISTRAPQAAESVQLDTRATIYIYSPLLDADIRLLQILPSATDSSPLRFRLVHLPLLTVRARRYTALSYTWGAEAATSTVFLNEKETRTRPTLAHILRRMRSLHYDFIWACPPPKASPCLAQQRDTDKNAELMTYEPTLTRSVLIKPT